MPALLTEMRADLESDQENVVRELFVMPTKGAMIGFSDKKRFRYNESEHESQREKLDFLERAGFVEDISTGRTPIYKWRSISLNCFAKNCAPANKRIESARDGRRASVRAIGGVP